MESNENTLSNLNEFKTANGDHYTGLIEDPNLVIVDRVDDRPLSMFPSRNTKYLKAASRFNAASDVKVVPNVVNYTSCCGDATNQSIGSCYMHAIVNQAKWLVWMHTGVKYSPSNATIDNVYAGGVSGGYYSAISRLWSIDEDDFIRAFKSVASKCGITKSNAPSGEKCKGYGDEGKENAIKMLNDYGPLWYAHNCGLYHGSEGYHAIIFIGYDEEYAYFQNSWGKSAGNPKVAWSHFVSYTHRYQTYFQTYGNVSGVNVWKDL